MEILYLMILCSVSLAAIFLGLFIYAIKKGQFDDDESPAVRMLFDSNEVQHAEGEELKNNEEKIK
ncbi:cbb3-type cytochrome oxidase assembly protein CcoS [Apibacter muscae]|uniref:Cbb3-type cytochrome oxidase assembly protein CcoS n=1 Tax=Apibacter muscae TaxID=2509004 RepID=A0A563DIV5_9FLAO|nr:cbb3-type cytochrome oxidase assembly protein CcoS [Apibacter muscae]TWP24740.1 cbb3-type cytochrome oxidase assembly protein CcoS [Apibacter muscae]TWP29793.1 cbb3-type cytochrome oxidase assembly protein CcoS [Apibacter muscae]